MVRLCLYGLALSLFVCITLSLPIGVFCWAQPAPQSPAPTDSTFQTQSSVPPPLPFETESFPFPPTQPKNHVATTSGNYTCKIYSLSDLGSDAKLAQWVSETIPQVIRPDSWKQPSSSGSKSFLTYNDSAKLLVVYHKPEVQHEIDAFLRKIRNNAPKNSTAKKQPKGPVQAKYSIDAPQMKSMQASTPAPLRTSRTRPKHLFHFIIRYEGAGVIDKNVVEFYKRSSAEESNAMPAVTREMLEQLKGAAIPAAPFVVPAGEIEAIPR